MTIRNNSEQFGLPGPYEAESIEAFVAECAGAQGFLRSSAADCWNDALNSEHIGEPAHYPTLADETREQYIERVTAVLASEFEDGLEIIS
jgi:hypothetical protein